MNRHGEDGVWVWRCRAGHESLHTDVTIRSMRVTPRCVRRIDGRLCWEPLRRRVRRIESEPSRELAAQRLVAAIFPTWYEEALAALARRCYRLNARGLFGWLADRADDLRAVSQRQRAANAADEAAGR